MWSEKPRLPDLPPLPTLAGEFLMGVLWFFVDLTTDATPADSITRNLEDLKVDEAMKAVKDAWDQAVRAHAPGLRIVVGPGKPRTQLKRGITQSIEGE